MRFLICFLLALFCSSLDAQLKPDYFPEEIPENLQPIDCIFCTPGVRNKSRSRGIELTYGITPYGDFKAQSTPFSSPLPSYDRLDHFLVDVKVPLVIKSSFNFLLSYKFSSERYNILEAGNEFPSAFQGLGSTALKSNSYGFIISKPLNELNYLAIQGVFTSSGNYRGWMEFKKRSAIYKLRMIYGFKKHDDMEWALGLSLTQSFRRVTILPFLVFNKNFRDRWGLEAILPAVIFVRYNVNRRNILLFGPKYGSRSYRFTSPINAPLPFDYAFNQSNVQTSFRWEHQFVPWVWAHLQVGYRVNFASEFQSKTNLPSFDGDPTDAPFFQISIFASPPRD